MKAALLVLPTSHCKHMTAALKPTFGALFSYIYRFLLFCYLFAMCNFLVTYSQANSNQQVTCNVM